MHKNCQKPLSSQDSLSVALKIWFYVTTFSQHLLGITAWESHLPFPNESSDVSTLLQKKEKKKENEKGYSSSDLASELLLFSTLKVDFFQQNRAGLKLQTGGKHPGRLKGQCLAALLSWK